MGSYVFKWPYPAKDVHVTGTFDDWAKSVHMEQVGDEWVKEVDLPLGGEKIYYKFVVDGIWKVDANLPTEGDGHYNTNNVLHPNEIKPKPVSSDDIPGAFPETPATEPSFFVRPIPATSGADNPMTVAPGATLPDPRGGTSKAIDATATTSKEDYEKAGSGPFPGSSENGSSQFSVKPIPATGGIGNPVSVPAGALLPDQKDITSNTVDSAVTTSKEDYEAAGSSQAVPESSTFSVNPIPASSGIGNPISLPAGATIPDQKDITSNTIDSTVTTSKEDYEKSGSGAFPAFAAAGVAGGALGGAALASAFSVSKEKNIIPESSLPMGSGATSAIQASPFISSSGPGTTTADLAAKVPFESERSTGFDSTTEKLASELEVPLRGSPYISSSATGATTSGLAAKVPVESDPTIRSSGPGTTTSALAAVVPLENTTRGVANEPITTSGVPETVKESIVTSHEAPEAAASTEAVKEKADVEKELLSKIPTSQATGVTGFAASSSVPEIVQESFASSREAPEAATSSEAVKEKSALEKELLSKIPTSQGTGTTGFAASSGVPEIVQESLARSHEAPEAATSTEAVKEKTDVEKELLSKVPTSQATGATGFAASSSVPEIVQESFASSHEAPEAAASSAAVQEKSALERELLSKTPATSAGGVSASAASEQTSYYGLATAVPTTVEKSMAKAQASPEAAVEPSAVAEKSTMEKELLSKVQTTDEAGEPAPTIAAATSSTAPTSTSTAAAASHLTDGTTANEPGPDTDTSSAARGLSAGELAGGAVVGGAAAAGAATLAARHNDADVEPPRIADSQKPAITTEASPATATTDRLPGQSIIAATTLSDGAATVPSTELPKPTTYLGRSEGETTEYAPVRTTAMAPGVSSAAAAALSDGTEDPTLSEEPAVQMMKQNEGVTSVPKPVIAPSTESTTTPAVTSVGNTTAASTVPSAVAAEAAAGVPSLTSAGTMAPSTAEKAATPAPAVAAGSTEAKAQPSAPSTPAKQRPQSMVAGSSPAASTGTGKSKKRHRLSAFIHKIFD